MRVNELYHWGIKGQKWGVRRFQNEDGSLTEEGIDRYKKKALNKYVSSEKQKVRDASLEKLDKYNYKRADILQNKYYPKSIKNILLKINAKKTKSVIENVDRQIEALNNYSYKDMIKEMSYEKMFKAESAVMFLLNPSIVGKAIAVDNFINSDIYSKETLRNKKYKKLKKEMKKQ